MFDRVVAFLPGYATHRHYDIASIPGNRLSDLIYCFAGFKQQGQNWVATFPEPADAGASKKSNVGKLVALKKRWPALNIAVSIGGWNHSHQGDPSFKTTPVFSAIAATPKARQAFVRSCIDLFVKPIHPGVGALFGGIDIDWEFPSSGDRHNLTLLFQEFRSQLDVEGHAQGRQLTLSASCGVVPSELELGSLDSTLDWINIMTYDAHLPYKYIPHNDFTDFGAPTYSSPVEPASNTTWNFDAVVASWLNSGFPADKLVVGINAYARTYAGVANSKHGVYQPYQGPGPGSMGKPGALEYQDLMANYLHQYESHWDDITKSAYLFSPSAGVWISFESVKSVGEKVLYARQKGLAGVMLWELSADAPSSESKAPGSKIPALLDAIPFGIRSLSNKAVLRATSDTTPALAFHGGRMFLAFKRPKNGHVRVMYSSNQGAKFGGTLDSLETSDAAPVLVDHKGHLIIAWKTAGINQLRVAQVNVVKTGKFGIKIAGLTHKSTLSGAGAVSMASHNGRLFLAWKDMNNGKLSLVFSSDNGATFAGNYVSTETSSATPALASHKGKLMIAWKGAGNDILSVAQVGLFADTSGKFGIEGLTNKIILGETSDNAPAMVSADRRLFLAWKGSGNDNLSVMFSEDSGASFGGKYISGEASSAAPALASDGCQIPIAWRGSGNEYLSVAQIAFF